MDRKISNRNKSEEKLPQIFKHIRGGRPRQNVSIQSIKIGKQTASNSYQEQYQICCTALLVQQPNSFNVNRILPNHYLDTFITTYHNSFLVFQEACNIKWCFRRKRNASKRSRNTSVVVNTIIRGQNNKAYSYISVYWKYEMYATFPDLPSSPVIWNQLARAGYSFWCFNFFVCSPFFSWFSFYLFFTFSPNSPFGYVSFDLISIWNCHRFSTQTRMVLGKEVEKSGWERSKEE